ncbi:hypothetical protein BDN70DRAFT_803146 [Pholiota conissans]|uniref:Uncharacterized protein n=1 Tax=Pholiota conissans TaxID=109636 RepID=A0A9P5Z545_9AGAR|nr:hypothetical protein BDN70DRAFT_803146 [Pholiota conissans]
MSDACAVSDYERKTYYNGVAGPKEGPPLFYRTGSAKYSGVDPKGQHVHQPTKSLRGVYCTPLNDAWNNVDFQIRDVIRVRKIRYSFIDPARFVDGNETEGPIIIWIGVFPGSTSADVAKEASQDILELLEKNGVEGADIEWRESVAEPF